MAHTGAMIPRIRDLAICTPLGYGTIRATWDAMAGAVRRGTGRPLDAAEDAQLWTACERIATGCGRHGFNPAVMVGGMLSLAPAVTVDEWTKIAESYEAVRGAEPGGEG